MDAPSRSVVVFLESLQDAMEQLRSVWEHYLRRGARPHRPFLVLGGRPFTVHHKPAVRQFHGCVALGLQIDGTDGREYELGVDILWDTDCWTITTEARVTNEPAGQDILRRLPERTADNLSTCVQQLRAAIDELVNFEDLVLAHGPLE
jgi:hypothetical protein